MTKTFVVAKSKVKWRTEWRCLPNRHWRNFFIRTRGTLPCPQIAFRSWCHYRRNFEYAGEEKNPPRRWVAADFLLIKKVCCSLAHEICNDKKNIQTNTSRMAHENQFADRRKVVYEKNLCIHISYRVLSYWYRGMLQKK